MILLVSRLTDHKRIKSMRFYAIIFLGGCYLGVLRLFVATFDRRLMLLLELAECCYSFRVRELTERTE